ncbi:SAF domain-containing protein [Isoptericola cucumis]|uniref:SAF domain-containing protein n=1 Tax=Isoptericola cucumis TaxID=1776856 RepID=UPI00320B3FA1
MPDRTPSTRPSAPRRDAGRPDRPSPRRLARRLRTLSWRLRYVLAAACCGIAAALVVQALRPEPPPTVDVVVPAHPLAAGEAVRRADLDVRTVPAAMVPADVLTDAGAVVGRAPAVTLPAGLPLHPGLLPGGGVVSQAPKGTVVVPVRLDETAAGWLRPGDRVDLLARDDGGATPVSAGVESEDGANGTSGAGAGSDAGSGKDDYLARRALVLPGTGSPADDGGAGGGLLGGAATGPSPGRDVTLVAVAPDDAPALSAASGWGTVGAVLVP